MPCEQHTVLLNSPPFVSLSSGFPQDLTATASPVRAASHSACPVAPLRAGPTYLIQGFIRQLINIKLNFKWDLSGTQKAKCYVLWWETGGEQPSPVT